MPADKLTTKATYPSGSIPPGANIVINVIGPHGDRDSAPDSGYEWKVRHNGVPLNSPGIDAISEAFEHGTPDRRDFNIKLKPDVRGSLEITLRGHDASTRQLNERWSYSIAEGAAASAPNPADPTPVESPAPPVDESLGPWPRLFDTRLEKLQSDVDEIKSALLEK